MEIRVQNWITKVQSILPSENHSTRTIGNCSCSSEIYLYPTNNNLTWLGSSNLSTKESWLNLLILIRRRTHKHCSKGMFAWNVWSLEEAQALIVCCLDSSLDYFDQAINPSLPFVFATNCSCNVLIVINFQYPHTQHTETSPWTRQADRAWIISNQKKKCSSTVATSKGGGGKSSKTLEFLNHSFTFPLTFPLYSNENWFESARKRRRSLTLFSKSKGAECSLSNPLHSSANLVKNINYNLKNTFCLLHSNWKL